MGNALPVDVASGSCPEVGFWEVSCARESNSGRFRLVPISHFQLAAALEPDDYRVVGFAVLGQRPPRPAFGTPRVVLAYDQPQAPAAEG